MIYFEFSQFKKSICKWIFLLGIDSITGDLALIVHKRFNSSNPIEAEELKNFFKSLLNEDYVHAEMLFHEEIYYFYFPAQLAKYFIGKNEFSYCVESVEDTLKKSKDIKYLSDAFNQMTQLIGRMKYFNDIIDFTIKIEIFLKNKNTGAKTSNDACDPALTHYLEDNKKRIFTAERIHAYMRDLQDNILQLEAKYFPYGYIEEPGKNLLTLTKSENQILFLNLLSSVPYSNLFFAVTYLRTKKPDNFEVNSETLFYFIYRLLNVNAASSEIRKIVDEELLSSEPATSAASSSNSPFPLSIEMTGPIPQLNLFVRSYFLESNYNPAYLYPSLIKQAIDESPEQYIFVHDIHKLYIKLKKLERKANKMIFAESLTAEEIKEEKQKKAFYQDKFKQAEKKFRQLVQDLLIQYPHIAFEIALNYSFWYPNAIRIDENLSEIRKFKHANKLKAMLKKSEHDLVTCIKSYVLKVDYHTLWILFVKTMLNRYEKEYVADLLKKIRESRNLCMPYNLAKKQNGLGPIKLAALNARVTASNFKLDILNLIKEPSLCLIESKHKLTLINRLIRENNINLAFILIANILYQCLTDDKLKFRFTEIVLHQVLPAVVSADNVNLYYFVFSLLKDLVLRFFTVYVRTLIIHSKAINILYSLRENAQINIYGILVNPSLYVSFLITVLIDPWSENSKLNKFLFLISEVKATLPDLFLTDRGQPLSEAQLTLFNLIAKLCAQQLHIDKSLLPAAWHRLKPLFSEYDQGKLKTYLFGLASLSLMRKSKIALFTQFIASFDDAAKQNILAIYLENCDLEQMSQQFNTYEDIERFISLLITAFNLPLDKNVFFYFFIKSIQKGNYFNDFIFRLLLLNINFRVAMCTHFINQFMLLFKSDDFHIEDAQNNLYEVYFSHDQTERYTIDILNILNILIDICDIEIKIEILKYFMDLLPQGVNHQTMTSMLDKLQMTHQSVSASTITPADDFSETQASVSISPSASNRQLSIFRSRKRKQAETVTSSDEQASKRSKGLNND